MKKQPVDLVAATAAQVRSLFTIYFNQGWISYSEMQRVADTKLLEFAALRKLLRRECRQRGVPLVYFSDDRQYSWLQVKESAKTRALLIGVSLMGNDNVVFRYRLKDQLVLKGRVHEVALRTPEVAAAVRALLEQQPFVAGIREIGAELYPVG